MWSIIASVPRMAGSSSRRRLPSRRQRGVTGALRAFIATSRSQAGGAAQMRCMPRAAECSVTAGITTHVAVTGEKPVTASVDPTYWANPSILVVTPDGFSQPSPHRALKTTEIARIIEQYRAAALNAKKAGFDGVELMAANGHLL